MGWTEQEYNSQRIGFIWDILEEVKKSKEQ